MPKVVFGFRKGERLDFRNVNEQDRPESPFKFVDSVNGESVKLVISWHGFLVFDIGVDIAAAMAEFMKYVSVEGCCGRCIPGKNGTTALAEKLVELRINPTYDGLMEAIALGESIKATSKCSLAPSSVSIVLSFLKEYPDQLKRNIKASKLNYHFHLTAPCTAACPANVPIPEFIDDLRGRRFLPALSTIRKTMPFPGLCGRVCPHPCETVCRRGEIDAPINIMQLKQSAWNYEYYRNQPPILPAKKEDTGRNCAIIGAGPAGLTAAYYLALAGHNVDVFEMLTVPGGMAAIGIPEFRQPKKLLNHEVNVIRSLGVKIHYNRKLGEDITLKYLTSTYDSTLIAIGAWTAQNSNIENIDGVEGVINSGIEFLQRIIDGDKVIRGNDVVVIGGGNTAIDCVRVARRFGCNVTLLYRRTQNEMPANQHEVEQAIEEGVNIMFLVAPLSVESVDNVIKGVECVKMRLGSPDATGRKSPEVIPFSNFIVPCSYLIPAIGQKPDISFLTKNDGINFTKWNTIVASNVYHNTTLDSVFTAGDCMNGPETVVKAVGSGRWAAKMMDRYMLERRLYLTPEEVMELALYDNKIFSYGEESDTAPIQERYEAETISIEERVSTFKEVEKPMSELNSSKEAKRCLRCMRLGMFATASKVVKK